MAGLRFPVWPVRCAARLCTIAISNWGRVNKTSITTHNNKKLLLPSLLPRSGLSIDAAKCLAGKCRGKPIKTKPPCGVPQSHEGNLWCFFSPFLFGAFYSLFVCLGVSLTSNAWSEALVVNQEAFLSLWLSSQKRETCKKIIKGISELVERATLKSSGLAFALCPRERERERERVKERAGDYQGLSLTLHPALINSKTVTVHYFFKANEKVTSIKIDRQQLWCNSWQDAR